MASRRLSQKEEGPLRVAKAAAPPEDSRAFGDGGDVSAAPRGKPVIGLHHRLKRRSAKRHHGFGGPASVTKVAVNFKIGVQRVGLNLRKSGLGAAYRARI